MYMSIIARLVLPLYAIRLTKVMKLLLKIGIDGEPVAAN